MPEEENRSPDSPIRLKKTRKVAAIVTLEGMFESTSPGARLPYFRGTARGTGTLRQSTGIQDAVQNLVATVFTIANPCPPASVRRRLPPEA